MNGSNFLGLLVLCGLVCVVWYKMRGDSQIHSAKKKFSADMLKDLPSETVDEELTMMSVVGYFRSLNLNSTTDIPFICKDIKTAFGTDNLPKKEGYQTLLFGVYNEKYIIRNSKIVYAKTFDAKLNEVLLHASKDGIVVLK